MGRLNDRSSIYLAPVMALVATVATFVAVKMVAPPDTYIYRLFFERSWIQHASTLCFWLTISTLLLKNLQHFRERHAYEAVHSALSNLDQWNLTSTLIWSDADRVGEVINADDFKPHTGSKCVTRIRNALDRLRKTQSTAALDDYFQTRSEVDHGELESSYATIQYLIWLIPTLGFIGTVMGIGIGIAGFAAIIQNAQDLGKIQEALPMVTSQLGTAFDTTLLALLLSAAAVFYSSHLMKKQEELLGDIDNLCFDGVVSLFREHSKDTEAVVEAVGSNAEELRQAMNGNRAALEALINAMVGKLQEVCRLSETMAGQAGARDEGQRQTGQQLAGQLQELKVMQKWLRDEIAMTREHAAAQMVRVGDVLERNNQLLERTLAALSASPAPKHVRQET